jgi:Flp pilus assembly pilin Flp
MKAPVQPIPPFLRLPRSGKRGQTLVEYALILAVLSVVAVSVFGLLDSRISVVFSAVANILDTAQSSH